MMAPLAVVARPVAASFPCNIYVQSAAYLQTARTILVTCGCKMILSGLFGGGEDNISA
jgi:hypothetical protein